MVLRALRKLMNGNVRGFLMTKYMGIALAFWIVIYFVAYMQIPAFKGWVDRNIRSQLPASVGGLKT